MKVVRKDSMIEYYNDGREVELVRAIMTQISHPFILRAEHLFQDQFRLYYVTEFMKYGNLFEHLCERKRFSEEQAAFFAA